MSALLATAGVATMVGFVALIGVLAVRRGRYHRSKPWIAGGLVLLGLATWGGVAAVVAALTSA